MKRFLFCISKESIHEKYLKVFTVLHESTRNGLIRHIRCQRGHGTHRKGERGGGEDERKEFDNIR